MTDKSERVTESVVDLIVLLRRFEEVYSAVKGLPWIGVVRPEQAFGRAVAALEALTTRSQPGEDAVERAARALCELQIRRARRWDTPEEKLEATLPEAVDYAWRDFIEEARAALNAAALPVENPQ